MSVWSAPASSFPSVHVHCHGHVPMPGPGTRAGGPPVSTCSMCPYRVRSPNSPFFLFCSANLTSYSEKKRSLGEARELHQNYRIFMSVSIHGRVSMSASSYPCACPFLCLCPCLMLAPAGARARVRVSVCPCSRVHVRVLMSLSSCPCPHVHALMSVMFHVHARPRALCRVLVPGVPIRMSIMSSCPSPES